MFGRLHGAQFVTLLWLAYRIDVVEQCFQQNVYKNGEILRACTHGYRKDFSVGGGHWWIFPKVFPGGIKIAEIWCLPLETNKTAIFAKIFRFLFSFRHYVCV